MSKRVKYACKYKPEYEKKFDFVAKSKELDTNVHCTYCKKDFSIAAGGVNDITRHSQGAKHSAIAKAKRFSKPLSFTSLEDDIVSKVSLTDISSKFVCSVCYA